jgi:hypothetical protein
MKRDMAEMDAAKAKQQLDKSKKKSTRGRDPGVAWVLDFDNDGVVSYEEMDTADQIFHNDPQILPVLSKEEL